MNLYKLCPGKVYKMKLCYISSTWTFCWLSISHPAWNISNTVRTYWLLECRIIAHKERRKKLFSFSFTLSHIALSLKCMQYTFIQTSFCLSCREKWEKLPPLNGSHYAGTRGQSLKVSTSSPSLSTSLKGSTIRPWGGNYRPSIHSIATLLPFTIRIFTIYPPPYQIRPDF